MSTGKRFYFIGLALVILYFVFGTRHLLATARGFTGFRFGANGDIPISNVFVR
jgi:hypothetical protein